MTNQHLSLVFYFLFGRHHFLLSCFYGATILFPTLTKFLSDEGLFRSDYLNWHTEYHCNSPTENYTEVAISSPSKESGLIEQKFKWQTENMLNIS
jgi:hypothetical protein